MTDRPRFGRPASGGPKGAHLFVHLIACLFFSLSPVAAVAQSANGVSPEQLQRLLNLPPDQLQQAIQGKSRSGQVAVPPTIPPSPSQALQPVQASSQPASQLETLVSKRVGVKLNQFGYGELNASRTASSSPVGSVQDDYILGPGDQIDITLRGQANSDYVVTVDRDGRVIMPGLPPVAAGGRTFGDFRQDLVSAVHRAFVSTDVYASVAQLRQVSVLVMGEVANPGQQTVSGLSTILDALSLAGGVKKSGSLRSIIIVRAGSEIRVDLYRILLARGTASNITLAQGDRILVPAIGHTVAITGDVRRPAIYELPSGSSAISQRELMALANGPEQRGVYREAIQKIRPDGKEQFVDVTNSPGQLVHDGEILFINRAVDASIGKVTLQGSVRLPGQYSLDTAKTLHDLLPSIDVFAPTPYMLMGVVARTDPQTLGKSLIPFSPLHVLQGSENMTLISNDEVRILTIEQMRKLAAGGATQVDQNPDEDQGADTKSASGNQFFSLPQTSEHNAAVPAVTGIKPANAAPLTSDSASAAPTSAAQSATDNATDTGSQPTDAASAAFTSTIGDLSAADSAFLGRVLPDYRVTLGGAVRDAGVYLVAPGTTLDEVVAAAGGLSTDADISSFIITSTHISNATGKSTTERQTYHVGPADFHSIALNPLDAIEFHHVFTDVTAGTVQVSGEVRYAGTYSILRGERLSQVLVRAGGLTDTSYPYGTVFLRRSVADIERAGYERVADEMQRQMMAGLIRSRGANQQASASPETVTAMQAFVVQLRSQKALGRVSIIADPSVLAAHPEKDPMLEPGDTIYIPQRPSTVTVLGDVMQPGNYQYDASSGASDYIDLAGGYGDDASEDLTYVVYPDGTTQRVQRSWLRFNSRGIPPGSVIYVPRDLFPTDWLVITTTVADLVKDLAISIASAAILSKN